MEKLFTIFLILLPVTNIYGCGIPGVSLGKLILIVLLMGLFVQKQRFIAPSIPSFWLPFCIWVLVGPFFYLLSDWFSLNDAIYKFIGVTGFWLTLGYGLKIVDFQYALKIYEKCAFVFSLIFLLQSAVFFATGRNLVFLIPGLPLADATSISDYLAGQSVWDRQCSVFLEPAYFAIYIAIFLCCYLSQKPEKLFSWRVFFYIAILLLIRSGNGYFCLIFLFVFFGVFRLRRIITNKKNLVSLLVLVAALSFFMYSSSQNQEFQDTFNRVSELDADYGEGKTSGFERIYRGYYLFDDLPALSKLIGIGQGNLEAFSQEYHLKSYMNVGLGSDSLYLNGIQQVLVFSGIIGVCLLLLAILCLCWSKHAVYIILMYVALSFMSATYNTPNMLFLLLFATQAWAASARKA